jgi:hypothetical protein
MTKIAIFLSLALTGAFQAQGDTKQSGYVVVVNTANTCNQTGKDAQATVKKLFLKELTQWPGGLEARPYAREGTSAEHAAFVKLVLGVADAELARHRLKMKNMSGTTPPKDVDTDRMVLKYVAKHQGAFGIVKADAAKGAEGVKILFAF